MRWTADTLASQAGGRLLRRGGRPIEGAFTDTRRAIPGALFVPILAERDGHAYLADAVSGGASAVLVAPGREPPAGDVTVVEVDDTLAALQRLAAAARAGWSGPVVAITGSNGKTTTRSFVEAVLRTGPAPVLATVGNFNNHLGVPLSVLQGPSDPAAAVLEIGMNAPGEVDRLAACVRPSVAVVTSVALEHVEFLGTLAAIADAETEVFAHLPADGTAIVPSDEPLLLARVPERLRAGLRTFGPDAGADVQVVAVELGERTHARLRTRDGELLDLRLRPFGLHHARNAAAALCVARALGLPLRAAAAALEEVDPVGDRGRVLEWGPHLVIADCYNANPGSMDAALRSLAALRSARRGPLVAVVGDMLELGPDAAAMHAGIGQLAADLGLDALVSIGVLARASAEAAAARGLETFSAREAIEPAVAWLRNRMAAAPLGGAVLVKGSRGARLERVVDALPRTDHDGVLDALDGRR